MIKHIQRYCDTCNTIRHQFVMEYTSHLHRFGEPCTEKLILKERICANCGTHYERTHRTVPLSQPTE